MREMQMVYAVMIPRLFSGNGYVVHDPLFGDKSVAEHEAQRLTKIARSGDKSQCYVKVFALAPQEEEVENQEEEEE